MKKKIIFIVNPIAGHHNKHNFPRLVGECLDWDQYECEIAFSEHPHHATELTEQAIAEHFDVVVAVGGDGTINEVGKCLIERKEQVLGIIPSGSGNGLAHHLELSMYPRVNIRDVINHGVVTKIDTATFNGIPFISIAGIGLDAVIAGNFARDSHRGLQTYVKFIFEKYPNYVPEDYRLVMDDEAVVNCAPLLLAFANSSQFGFNAKLSPKASIVDGLLDVCVLRKPHLIEAPYVACCMFTTQIDKTSFVDIYRAKHIRVERQNEGPANIDGEPLTMGKVLDVKINPLSLNVLLPKK